MNILLLKIKKNLDEFRQNNCGASIVEIILILVILVSLILIFKTQISGIINSAFQSISNDSGKIIN